MTTHDKINIGIAEMLAGMKSGDMKRSDAGQELVRQALAQLQPMPVDALMELHRAATAMYEAAMAYLPAGSEALGKFLSAREQHQKTLAKLSKGSRILREREDAK